MKPCFNNRKIVVEMKRSPQVLDVLKQSIHQAAFSLSQQCQMGDTIIEIPDLAPFAKDFEYAIAKN